MVSWLFGRKTSPGTRLRYCVAAGGMVVTILITVQLLGVSWYMGKMMPGTTVGNIVIGNMTVPQARDQVRKLISDYHVQLAVGSSSYIFSPDQLGIAFDTETTLTSAYQRGRASWWQPVKREPILMAYHLATPTLAATITSVATQIGVQPVDASLQVVGGQIRPVAETDGYTLDKLELARRIQSQIGSGLPSKLVAIPKKQTADIVLASLESATSQTQQLINSSVTLSYKDHIWTPSPAAIGSWITFSKDASGTSAQLVPQVDVSKLKSYVQTLANQVNVAAVNQLVTVQNDVSTVNRVGADGTSINQDDTVGAIQAAVMARESLSYVITDTVIPYKTITTNFKVLNYPKYIEINLQKQHLWLWENGSIIYDTPITSGATGAGFPTVEGLFAINYKTTNTHLVGYQYGPRYNYDVSVKYWMPFHDGYGLHDASWRHGNFGGQDYYRGGSHGCVNLPDAAAAFIYNWASVGTPVWLHE